jgi:hypothetical protein
LRVSPFSKEKPTAALGSLKDEQKTDDLVAYLKQFDADGKKK